MPVRSAIIPNLHYQDAPAAIDFLCNAFGFTARAVYPDDKNPAMIQHAQLVRDDVMIMLSSFRDTEFSKLAEITSVANAGGNTQTPYIILSDVDAHCERAQASGAKIIMPPKDQDYGGRVYSARDPEGYTWSFGSYDPWAD